MKFALYYPWVYLTSGAERSILELTGRSRYNWTIFTHRFDPATTFPGLKDRDIRELSPRVSVDRSFGAVAKAAGAVAGHRLSLEGYRALMVVSEGVGDFITLRNSHLPILCLCLTPLRPVFDAAYRARFLQGKNWRTALALSCFSHAFKVVDRLLWKRYRRVFCISEEARRRVLAGGLYSADRMEVAYPGVDIAVCRPTWKYEHYFLLPGRIMWTKNIELGIQAFQHFIKTQPEHRDFRLVIAGIVDEKSRPYFAKLQSLSAGESRITFVVHPSDETLARLYQQCYGVLFTAFNEDWGMVPLEGMAYGKPVISVNSGGPRESIQHNKNGFLVDPDPEAFSRTMAAVARDEQIARRIGECGRERSHDFDWTAFVGRIDQYLERFT